MADEKWIIHPGETRVIDIESIARLRVGLVGGQIDIVGHDEPEVRVEVHSVAGKDLRIELDGDGLDIDHPQLGWDNMFELFSNLGSGGPRAEISVAVPREVLLTLGVVSATALVSGLAASARVNTVSGDVLVDGLVGDLGANAVSGEVQARGLVGAFVVKTVSGETAVTGELTSVDIDTISGGISIDADGPVGSISTNTVSGDVTVRLDDDYPMNYVIRTAGGAVRVDGITYSSGPTSHTGSTGELAGRFVDLRAHTISGDVVVLRRGTTTATVADDHDAEATWPAPRGEEAS